MIERPDLSTSLPLVGKQIASCVVSSIEGNSQNYLHSILIVGLDAV